MQIRCWFAYDYDFQKWEVQYYYRPEFGGRIQIFYFPVNFKLSGLNHRKYMGTREDMDIALVLFSIPIFLVFNIFYQQYHFSGYTLVPVIVTLLLKLAESVCMPWGMQRWSVGCLLILLRLGMPI